ncbi:hypothetical protein Tco_1070553 [Tanacetum coccineum]|uniref:Uncharacterized protein n=1 Tax=Tanacetum coccineum TaxID=301880 RepID=A0ABQ5HLP9_9ASTR
MDNLTHRSESQQILENEGHQSKRRLTRRSSAEMNATNDHVASTTSAYLEQATNEEKVASSEGISIQRLIQGIPREELGNIHMIQSWHSGGAGVATVRSNYPGRDAILATMIEEYIKEITWEPILGDTSKEQKFIIKPKYLDQPITIRSNLPL